MERLSAQLALFAEQPTRRALCEATGQSSIACRNFVINVWRNHSFEFIASLVTPFAAWGRFAIEWRLSVYDDALSFFDYHSADLELIWLDRSRQARLGSNEDHEMWLDSRVRALRKMSDAPIVLVTWTDDTRPSLPAFDTLPGVYVADLSPLAREVALPLVDQPAAEVSGTAVNPKLHAVIARKLAAHWVASALLPPIKAIVVDLDDTLHEGVLGEDGPSGVLLTPGHRRLQGLIKELSRRGLFVAMVSHNDVQDVRGLFAQRTDYVLRLEDFSTLELGWSSKASAIARIIDRLNIGVDSVLFVDDNWGEIDAVLRQLPPIHIVWAQPDASLTARAIEYCPGLWQWNGTTADTLRARDIQARAERLQRLSEATDQREYLRQLEICLTFRVDPLEQRTRLHELSRKTNQFNLTLRRFSDTELSARLLDAKTSVVSVELTDRLAASGIIAVVVGVRRDNSLEIEELAISCRALGRALEDTIVLDAIRHMPAFIGCEVVAFHVTQGERNQPAVNWLTRLLELSTAPVSGRYEVAATRIRERMPPEGLTVHRG